MGFKALTVNTAAEAAGHIYAEDDAAIFQSMFGGDGVLNIGNCLKSTVISNNKVRISDGVLSVGGHIGRLSHADYQDMTIENGATGYNRNDIIYARFLTSGNVDSFILAVKKGTATTGIATDPSLVQGNLYEGAVERDYPLYRVKLSGLSISSVDQLFTVIPTIPDLKAQMEKDKAEINQSLTDKANALVQKLHPVGSWYFSTVATNPVDIFGFGTWQLITDRFLIGAGTSYASGAMGGEAVHTLTAAELPTHQHNVLSGTLGGNNGNYKFMLSSQSMYGTYDGNYGVITDDRFITAASSAYCGNQPHNNIPPYYAIYMWVRTA